MIYLNDLLLTEAFLIKGHINTANQRLSTFLNNFARCFLEIDNATVNDYVQDTNFHAPRILMRVEEILMAYELEEIGDEGLRHLAGQDRDYTPVVIQFGGDSRLQLQGRLSRRAMERDSAGHHDFLVVVEPKLTGTKGKSLDVFENLPYLIANRSRIAFIRERS
jgi:hypothetical protein